MNKKEFISDKQCFYLVLFELFGVLTLFLPGLLSRKVSQDSPVSLTLGFAFCAIYAWILYLFKRKYHNELLQVTKKKSLFIELLVFLFFVQSVMLAVFALNITWEIVQMFLLPDFGRFIIMFVFFLVSVYALQNGIRSRAKMAELCGKIFFIIFIFIFIFSLKKIDLNQYEAIFISSPKQIVSGAYDVFVLLEIIVFSMFAIDFSQSEDKYPSILKKSIFASFVIALVFLLVLMGTFGVDYVGKMQYPAIRLLRNITNSSSFISRLDVLMIWIWLVSLFYFLCGSMNYANMLLESVLEGSSGKKMKYALYIVIFLVAMLFGNVTNSYYIYRNYMVYIGTPLTILSLIIALFLPVKKEKDLESVG